MRKILFLSLIFAFTAAFAVLANQDNSKLRNFVLGISTGLADSVWPMYHAGERHGGLSTVDTSHVDGTVKWKFETGAGIESSPAIGVDGTIYVGSHDNKLYAINPDGSKKWEFKAGEPIYDDKFDVIKGIVSSPAVAADGTIYFSSLADYFFAINPDGTEKWRIELPFSGDTWTSPAVGPDGIIYTGAARRFTEGSIEVFDPRDLGGLYAINPDGTVKWHVSTGRDMAPSPAIASDGTVYYGTYGTVTEGFLVAVDALGEEKWRFNTGALIESSATIGSDGTVYVGSKSGRVYALNPDGTEKWYFEVDPAYISDVPEEKREYVDEYHLNGVSAVPAIAADGTVYIGAWNSYLYALSPEGALKWKFKTPIAFEGIVASAAIGADGTVYIGSNAGVFYGINPDGTEKWSYDTKSSLPSSPAIGPDGTVYVGAWDNNLYAFGGSGKVTSEVSSIKNIAQSLGAVPVVIGGGVILVVGAIIFIKKRR